MRNTKLSNQVFADMNSSLGGEHLVGIFKKASDTKSEPEMEESGLEIIASDLLKISEILDEYNLEQLSGRVALAVDNMLSEGMTKLAVNKCKECGKDPCVCKCEKCGKEPCICSKNKKEAHDLELADLERDPELMEPLNEVEGLPKGHSSECKSCPYDHDLNPEEAFDFHAMLDADSNLADDLSKKCTKCGQDPCICPEDLKKKCPHCNQAPCVCAEKLDKHSAIDEYPTTKEEIGLLMMNYHTGQWDPVYMVGSVFFSGQDYPDLKVVQSAIGYLEQDLRKATEGLHGLGEDEVEELSIIIDFLNNYIQEQGGISEDSNDVKFKDLLETEKRSRLPYDINQPQGKIKSLEEELDELESDPDYEAVEKHLDMLPFFDSFRKEQYLDEEKHKPLDLMAQAKSFTKKLATFLDDYEPCHACGFDHQYEPGEAQLWHKRNKSVDLKDYPELVHDLEKKDFYKGFDEDDVADASDHSKLYMKGYKDYLEGNPCRVALDSDGPAWKQPVPSAWSDDEAMEKARQYLAGYEIAKQEDSLSQEVDDIGDINFDDEGIPSSHRARKEEEKLRKLLHEIEGKSDTIPAPSYYPEENPFIPSSPIVPIIPSVELAVLEDRPSTPEMEKETVRPKKANDEIKTAMENLDHWMNKLSYLEADDEGEDEDGDQNHADDFEDES